MKSIFSKIIAGEVPSEKIYEDDETFAFLDINPNNPGHTLVIPKAEFENIYEIPEDLFLKVMSTVKRLAPAVRDAVGAEGVNIVMNNESAAGQIVPHVHVHIIPRFSGDGHKHWHGTPYAEGKAAVVAAKILNTLRKNGRST